MTQIFVGKQNGQIQELIGDMWLMLCYTVQLVIHNVCTKFQIPKSSSFREIFEGKEVFRQTNKHSYRKVKNYIPLYTSYVGGIMKVIESFLIVEPKSRLCELIT